MPFTAEELAEMAAADAEIESGFSLSKDDMELAKELDREARWADLPGDKARAAARNRAYYEANKDKVAARNRAYYEANKDKVAARNRAYREAKRQCAR